MSMLDRVVGAPISWGVCEVAGWGYQLPAARVLEEMRALGLRATEVGPEGFLPGDPVAKVGALAAAGLAAVGEDLTQERYQRAARWLRERQNPDGGWGESYRSYEEPAFTSRICFLSPDASSSTRAPMAKRFPVEPAKSTCSQCPPALVFS